MQNVLFIFLIFLLFILFFGWLSINRRYKSLKDHEKYLKSFAGNEGSQLLPVQFALVAGTRYKNADGSDRQKIIKKLKADEVLLLIPEKDNPVDKEAVKVSRISGEQIGYLDMDLAIEIKSRLENGYRVDAKVAEIIIGKTREVKIGIQRYSRRKSRSKKP